ncbi:MAG: S-methyl-5-thioribose-1-phosphate isomerase [Planctomycetota bacterium]|nr:S-methyl-5-thioribose-1-phosphate isomerase [Blastopirellula sp.]
MVPSTPTATSSQTARGAAPRSVRWEGAADGQLWLLDQTRLPAELFEFPCPNVQTVWEAIRQLKVRGAPAIGIAAAYGVVTGMQEHLESVSELPSAAAQSLLDQVCDYLATSRPTAVNLFWALDRMRTAGTTACATKLVKREDLLQRLLQTAVEIHAEDREMCHAIGRNGVELLRSAQGVLTHCNAGGLATAEYGTALAAIFAAQDAGHLLHVYVDETRPLLQGARLTAWELQQRGVPATLICDSMAAQVMREGRVQAVITGADRIAANGDSANKIGTYGLAVLAAAHGIPFYIAAPSSTFDLSLESGEGIPIEQRAAEEITEGFGRRTAPLGIEVYNPAFDVTPAKLIRAIITEQGIISPVTTENVRRQLQPHGELLPGRN